MIALTVYVATPLDKVPVPSVVVPSRNVTVPVAADGDVVAVSVMLEPVAGAVFDALSAVVVEVTAPPPATVTLMLPITKLAEGGKKPICVALSRVEGMVAEAVCPPQLMVPVAPLRVTVRAAAALLG